MRSVRTILAALSVAASVLTLQVLTSAPSGAATFTNVTLVNGWTNAPFSTTKASVTSASGVVTFKGAIAGGSTGVAFTLPAQFRPPTSAYVPVDMCNATKGRLFIQSSGVVTVQAEKLFSNAQCFTSLEGASFAIAPGSFTPLTLQNGWTNAPFSTANAAAKNVGGIVHLMGAIATTGTNAQPFTLPAGFRPPAEAYVPVDLCNATNGRLHISSTGVVTVEAEGGTFSNAQCFTSLEGVSFSTSSSSFTALTPLNGWTNGPFATSNAAAESIDGVVHLMGAIATTGTNPVAFTLPAQFRPPTAAYVHVDLCGATNGRLFIQPNGTVTVQSEGAFSSAACFTSLDGAVYSVVAFTALKLQNGWTNAPFATAKAAVISQAGMVTFKGAIATGGTNPVPFTLPPAFRPSANAYVPVDLCNATKGRLFIAPSGVVTVQAENGTFSNAACFTSLEGASFSIAPGSFLPVTLQNGWTNGPFGTANAGYKNVNGIVHLMGAIATAGTNPVAFTLPVGFRPPAAAYVPVDLCGATNGRLFIAPTGVVTVEAEGGTFSNAQCFTSLEGASFTANPTFYTALTLQNGWTNAPFSTSNAAVRSFDGSVHLMGAIATSGTNPVPFTLPAAFRPPTNVFVPVDLCNAANGRLDIAPNGTVSVQAENGTFSNAACFTSLEGVNFAP
jgi:hypothetical protein